MARINIATDFSDRPGARYVPQGGKTGEEFYDEILKPKYNELIESGIGDKLIIDLDNTYGYPPSFLSEAFGRLYQDYNQEDIWNHLEFITNDDPSLEDVIRIKAKKYVSQQ